MLNAEIPVNERLTFRQTIAKFPKVALTTHERSAVRCEHKRRGTVKKLTVLCSVATPMSYQLWINIITFAQISVLL